LELTNTIIVIGSSWHVGICTFDLLLLLLLFYYFSYY